MTRSFKVFTSLARDLQHRLTLEEALKLVVDRSAEALCSERVSVRLLDPSRRKLLATCRHGDPIHVVPQEFALGEGLIGWIAEHAEPLRTGDADADPRFAPRAQMQVKLGSFLGVPLLSGEICMGVLSAVHAEAGHFSVEHEEVLSLIAAIAAPRVEIARLSRLSRVDPLTGALNRRGGEALFAVDPARDGEIVKPLSVALADVDHFKQVNDRYGHAVGDEVLKRVAAILADVLRQGDAVIRHGGDEFLLVLPGVGTSTALRVAERARRGVTGTCIDAADDALRVTLSIGVAERRDGELREDLIARADSALYAAKQAGRNNVAHAD